MSCIKHQMIDALRTKYEGDYKIAHSTLNIYMDKPVAIGEHPQHAEEMDKLVAAMADAQDKIDILDKEYPQEKLELRYLDSGPFTQTPSQFWDEKGEELEKQPEKHEYVLTSDDVSDYNDADIKNSWLADDDDDEEELEDEKFSVLGNKS